MTKCSLSSLARILACCALIVLCLGLCNPVVAAGPAAQSAPNKPVTQGPKIWLQENQPLTVTHVGAGAASVSAGQPLSMVAADVDQDGVQDLLVGYGTPSGGVVVFHRGNLDAFAPQSEASFQAIGRGEFPAPFLPEANAFPVPVNPDFLVVGDFTGHGMTDLAVAARGGSAIYILAGDGQGHFTPGDTINLPGGVTALAAGRFGNVRPAFIVGVSSGRQSFLAVYGPGRQGLTPVAAIPLSAPASNILFGDFGDPGMDVAFLSGGKIQILRSSAGKLTTVALPVSVSAFALGSFIYDRSYGQQIAVLTPDGSVQIAARNEFDPRVYTAEEFRAIRQAKINRQPAPAFVPVPSFPASGWRIVEGFPGVSTVAAGQDPLFFRTRISVNGADDIMWLSASGGQMVVISHADVQPGAATFIPGQVSLKPYNGSPIAAAPMRVNVDSRPGVLALHQGQIAPSISMPIPDPTFTVNRFDDPTPANPISGACNGVANDCSLREAILKSNGDTVMVPAGTYTLSIAKVANDCTGNFGALSVERTTTIMGAGQNTTIIQAGTVGFNPGPANGVDMVINVNEDLGVANCPTTNASASISNLTIQNGVNRGASGVDGDGGCMEYDTGTNGTATLALTNVTLQNCSTLQGGGGGLVIFNFVTPAGAGGATISNSIVQGNSVVNTGSAGLGGGIAINFDAHMTMTASQVLNNSAVQNCTPTCGLGAGGGIIGFTPQNVSAATGESFIHSSTISGNKAAGFGGGINTSASITIDQGTVISGNIAGTDGSNNTAHPGQEGGGLYLNPANACPLASTCTAALSKVRITGNTATGNGGGISYGNGSAGTVGALSMNFSRLAGNTTSGGSGSNFSNNHGTATVTNNWWGTNAASGTLNTISGTTTFDPFIVLTHTSSPHPIRINQSSTLTANMSLDNHGVGTALSGKLDEIIQLPLTFDGAALGTIPNAQPETLGNPLPIATATFNAGGASGLGDAVATLEKNMAGLENYAVHVNTNLIASATESGTTATITTVGVHGFTTSDFVTITGVTGAGTCSGYNGSFFPITTTTTTTFTFTAPVGLSTCSGGTASIGLVVLEPPSIAKAFSPSVIQSTSLNPASFSTITFTLKNQNVVPIDASFTDNLPTVAGPHPGSLVVASTPSVVNNCGGSVTATAGSGSISFSNANLAAGTCTISVNVSSAVDDQYSNSVTIDSTVAGNGNTSSDTLNVINPPHITKSFGASTIPLLGTTSLTINVDNGNNQNQTLSAITFTDTLPNAAPGTLVVATPNNLSNNCSGTATATPGSGSVSLASSSLAPGASCTVSANVQGSVAGAANNSVTASDTTAGSGNTASAFLTVLAPPMISKAFNPKSVPLNSNSTLSFTVTNPNTASALSGVAFTDTLPGGLKLASTTVTGSCGSGTITATINNPPGSPSTVSLSGGTLTASPAAGSSCTFSVSVTGISAGAQINTTGTVASTEGGTGGTASDTLIVVAPPTISKSFSPKSVPLNSNSTLSFTVTNPNTASALSGVAFTDSLSGGLKLASTLVTGSCGSGTITATINNPPGTPSTVSLSGGTLTASPAAGSSCTFSVSVTGIAAGTQVNTTGTVSSTEGGTGGTASDTLTVVAPPTISKSFSPKTIPSNGSSTLSFTVTNPNTVSALSGVAFTDSLPGGLKLASTTVVGSCGSGTITAAINNPPGSPSTVSLSGGTLTASPDPASSCTFSVSVTGISAGAQVNTTGIVSSTEGGTGGTASDTLTVVAPPTISKHFGHTTVPLNQSDTLSFTLTNPNTTSALSGIAFTDTLPGGLKLASTTVTGSCGSGTITAAINNPPGSPSTVSLSGGTLTASPAAGSSCTFSVSITGISAGAQVNTTSTVSSTEGGTGGTATDIIIVVAPPTTTKVFNPTTIAVGGTSTMTITVTNPSATLGLTGVGFTDTFPANLVVANPNGLSNTCNGTPSAVAGSGAVSLTFGTIAANSSCAVTVNVTSSVSGTYLNSTGPISSTEGGAGGAASATLTVASPPTISKSFSPKSIPLNGNSTLSFTLTNPNNNVALSGVSVTDTLPGGVKLASTTVTGSCGSGTITATINNPPGSPSTVSLSGGTLASSGSCTFSVSVTGISAGAQVNTTSTVSSTEGGTGGTASDTLTVIAPPTIAKHFGHTTVPLNQSDTLSFTLTNPNTASALSGIAFTDTLPGGLKLASTTVTGSCGSGTITGTINNPPGSPSTVSLSGGTLTASPAAGSSCTFSVSITGISAGAQVNTTSTVSSTEGGTGGTASDTITVVAAPTTTKVFVPTTIAVGGTSTMTITITNPSATVGLTGVGFTDTFPANLVVATPNGLSNTCNGTPSATAGSGTVSLTGGSIAANSSCAFTVNVTSSVSGNYLNSTGPISSTEGGSGAAASATLTVAQPPASTKAFTLHQIPLNGTTTLTINITNPNSNVAFTGVAFTDNFPGLVVAPTPNASNTCGGTFNPVAGAGSATLSGGTLAVSASCAVKVDVQGTTAGTKTNSVTVSATNGGSGTAATDTLTVVAPPTVLKSFTDPSVALNVATTTMSFLVSNPNSTVGLTGIGFTDNLPAGLQLNSTTVTGACGSGTVTSVIGPPSSVTLAGGTLPANAFCAFQLTVKGTTVGTKNNTTSTVTSAEGGTGATSNTASVNVDGPPTIAKGFNPGGFQPNGVSFLTITITNPAANPDIAQGVAFNDSFPANLVIATPNGLTNTCGGTPVGTAGTLSLTGGSILANSSCTVTVNVTSSFTGSYLNTAGPVSSTNGGTGGSASATVIVAMPPTISKQFVPTSTVQGGTSLLSFTINNNNSNSTPPNSDVTLTGISFTDSLPAGLQVAATPNVSSDCGGTLTANPGSTTVTLTGGAIAPAVPLRPRGIKVAAQPAASGACFISLKVQATTAGTFNNTTGPISANESGPGAGSNTATLTVAPPPIAPTVTKVFGATSIPLNATTTLTFNITNPNASVGLANVSLSDALPAGLAVANPNGVSGSCVTSDEAVVTAVPGTQSINMTGLALLGGGSCSYTVNVTGVAAGIQNNMTGNITATFDDGTGTFVTITGGTASASINVVAPPSIAKAFNPALINPGATSTLTFTITNPSANTAAEAGVAFTDTLPANLVVATPNGVTGSCGGTVTATAGTGTVTLSGGTIPAGGSCAISVNVTSTVPATYNNATTVSSTNGGTGNTATATLIVGRPNLSITKTHTGNFPRNSTGNNYTITVSNGASAAPTVGTVTVTDTLPNVTNPLVATAMTGTGWSCTLTTLTCTRSDSLAPGASYPPITLTVTVPQNIQANVVNSATVSGGNDLNSHTANDPTHIGPPVQLTPQGSNNAEVVAGGQTSVVITVDSNAGEGTLNMSCSGLPGGAACAFNPPSTNALSTQVTVIFGTTLGTSTSARPPASGPGLGLYAMLFPVFGVLLLGAGAKRDPKRLRRLVVVFGIGLLLSLLVLSGCGGLARTGTPAAVSTVTITATSAATGDSGSTTITLTVLNPAPTSR